MPSMIPHAPSLYRSHTFLVFLINNRSLLTSCGSPRIRRAPYGTQASSDAVVPDGEWSHVLLVYDGGGTGDATIYINGRVAHHERLVGAPKCNRAAGWNATCGVIDVGASQGETQGPPPLSPPPLTLTPKHTCTRPGPIYDRLLPNSNPQLLPRVHPT